jgi:hypothetical protein
VLVNFDFSYDHTTSVPTFRYASGNKLLLGEARVVTWLAFTLGALHCWYADTSLIPLAHQISGMPVVNRAGLPLIFGAPAVHMRLYDFS